jgi:hypothetical protein
VTIDGVEQPDNTIPLIDDHQEQRVEVRIPWFTVNHKIYPEKKMAVPVSPESAISCPSQIGVWVMGL